MVKSVSFYNVPLDWNIDMVSVLTYYFSSIAMELFKGVLLCFMKVIIASSYV